MKQKNVKNPKSVMIMAPNAMLRREYVMPMKNYQIIVKI